MKSTFSDGDVTAGEAAVVAVMGKRDSCSAYDGLSLPSDSEEKLSYYGVRDLESGISVTMKGEWCPHLG